MDAVDRGAWRGRLLKKLALLLASTVLSVLAADLLFRWYEARFVLVRAEIGEDMVDLAALSLNDSAVPRKASPSEFRVLCMGDSFAFGPVKYRFTYHAVAARDLAGLGLARGFRFVNLGEPAISFYEYMDRYDYWDRIIEHDGAVFTVYLGNDILDVAAGRVPHNQGVNRLFRDAGVEVREWRARKTIPSKYPLRLLDYLRANYLVWSGAFKPHTITNDDPYHSHAGQLSEDVYYDKAYTQLENFDAGRLPALRWGYQALIHFVRFVSAIRMSGTQVAVVLAPCESQVDRELRSEVARRYDVEVESYDLALPAFLIAETVQRIDPRIPLLDLSGPFEHVTEEGMDLYFGTNTHWSVEGNELAGTCLARFLAEHWFGARLQRAERIYGLVGRPYGPMNASGHRESRLSAIKEFLVPLLEGVPFAVERVSPDELTKLLGEPLHAIDTINGRRMKSIQGAEQDGVVDARKDGFCVTGWAVDVGAGDVADSVLVEINGEAFRADYGLPRGDVARYFSNQRYYKSGFILTVPADTVPPGPLNLRLLVISRDGSGIYTGRLTRLQLQ